MPSRDAIFYRFSPANWPGLTLVKSDFKEEDHPRADDGKFGSGGGGGRTDPKTGKQRRAAAGGEMGPNSEWYPGGAFIATTDMPKREKDKLKKAATGKVNTWDGWEVPEPGMMAICDKLGGTVLNPRDGELNYRYIDFRQSTKEEREAYEEISQKWKDGERWISVNDYPFLAGYKDLARLVVAGMPIPGDCLKELPQETRDHFEKYSKSEGKKEEPAESKPDSDKPAAKKSHPAESVPHDIDAAKEHIATLTDNEKAELAGHYAALLSELKPKAKAKKPAADLAPIPPAKVSRLTDAISEADAGDMTADKISDVLTECRAMKQGELYSLISRAGVEGARPSDSKADMMRRVQQRLLVAQRARERAEV